MNATLPPFIAARLAHGLRCGLLSKTSTAHQVYNVIGHKAYVFAAVRLIRA